MQGKRVVLRCKYGHPCITHAALNVPRTLLEINFFFNAIRRKKASAFFFAAPAKLDALYLEALQKGRRSDLHARHSYKNL